MTTKSAVIITAVSVVLIMTTIFGTLGVFMMRNVSAKVEAGLVSKVAQREADYQALIESANQKIQTLNAQPQACPSTPENVNKR